jgi:hypothetical protein
MEKIGLLKDIFAAVQASRAYQNLIREAVVQVQQKLRWISLARKKSVIKRNEGVKRPKRKRVPYHSCYQLLNILRTKIKRTNFSGSGKFSVKEMAKMGELVEKFPNQWGRIGKEMKKLPVECFRAFRQRREDEGVLKQIKWTNQEDFMLVEAVARLGKNNWTEVANYIDGKTSSQCYQRYMKTINPKIHLGKWTKNEDIKLLLGVKLFGTNWIAVSSLLKQRTDIQCRERFCNVLSPTIKNSCWSFEEDLRLIIFFLYFGKKWSKIASFIKGRTDNQCWRRSKLLIKSSALLRSLFLLKLFRRNIPPFLKSFYKNLTPLLF